MNRTATLVVALSLLAAGSALAGPKSSGSGGCTTLPVCCKTLKANCCQLSAPCCEKGNTAFFTTSACTAFHARGTGSAGCGPQSAAACAGKSDCAETANAEAGNAGFFRSTLRTAGEKPARRAAQPAAASAAVTARQ
jgi:hypothetical protein